MAWDFQINVPRSIGHQNDQVVIFLVTWEKQPYGSAEKEIDGKLGAKKTVRGKAETTVLPLRDRSIKHWSRTAGVYLSIEAVMISSDAASALTAAVQLQALQCRVGGVRVRVRV